MAINSNHNNHKNEKNKSINCIILASGNGSNAINLIKKFSGVENADEYERLNIIACISNIENAPVIDKVRNLANSLPMIIIPYRNKSERGDFENELEIIIRNYNVDLIILAGFMRVLSDKFVSNHPNKIINIHPSLLPSFKGKDAIEQAYEYGVKYTGVTVHFVTPEIDSGPIIYQEVVKIEDGETIESLEMKIHTVEHKIYPLAIKYLISRNLIS